ncbi:MAG: colicin E3/pyocin S6 family cytotoxin [Solirubrobacteraceae bacterium]
MPPIPAPRDLAAFPDALRVRPKTHRADGSRRTRWKDPDGRIYEWDSQHGAVEQYDVRGRHLGQFDPLSGARQKAPDRARRIEP